MTIAVTALLWIRCASACLVLAELDAARERAALAERELAIAREVIGATRACAQADARSKLFELARRRLDAAHGELNGVEATCLAMLDDRGLFPPAVGGQALRQGVVRYEVRTLLTETRLAIVMVAFEKAGTFASVDVQRQALLLEAAQRSGDLSDRYRKWPAGRHARLMLGRCYFELEAYDEAAHLLKAASIDLQSQPEWRPLVTQAHRYLAECRLAQNKPREVIEHCRDWLVQSGRLGRLDADWPALAYLVAVAARDVARPLPAGSCRCVRAQLLHDARRFASWSAQLPSEHQASARRLVAELAPCRCLGVRYRFGARFRR